MTDRLRPHRTGSASCKPAQGICRAAAALRLLLQLVPTAGRAAEPVPPRRAPVLAPVLVIETGAHSRDIQSLSTDAASRYLLTGAADASARIWDAASGRLLQVLRPPLADHESSVDAVALSRSGGTAAVAVRATGPEPSTRIYLFDRASGRLLHRTAPVSATVRHLAFSGDGDRIAAALDRGGTAVFVAHSAARLTADLACAAETPWADFDATGRLAVSCADGAIRIYDPSLRLQAEARPEPGAVPAAVRFSPDGSRIALGYADRPALSLLSARDLSLLSRPDTTGIEATELHAVTWSPDGSVLCAGGARGGGQSQIRCWDATAPGRPRDLTVPARDLVDLVYLPSRDLIFSDRAPRWSRFSASIQQSITPPADRADFRDTLLRVSHDGTRVGFRFGPHDPSLTVFALAERGLRPHDPAHDGLRPPVQRSQALQVSGGPGAHEVVVNGRPLPPREVLHSLAVLDAPPGFLLGTGSHLRAFDAAGAQRWAVPLPAAARSVNASGDGRLIVAALDDGTIRWYAAASGEPLLSLLPHPDRSRWIAWTADGFYDAAPGGDDLLGLRSERSDDEAADFWRVALLRRHLHRPEVIGAALRPDPPRPAAIELQRLMPPTVQVLDPADGEAVPSSAVRIRVALRTPSNEPITAVRAVLRSRLTQSRAIVLFSTEGAQKGGAAESLQGASVRTLTVQVPAEDCTVVLQAETAQSASEPAVLHLRWAGPGATTASGPRSLHVLAIGVGRYRDELLRLDYPAKDARDFAATLKEQQGKLYQSVEVQLLTDEGAARAAILAALARLRERATERDVTALFFAGHGINQADSGRYYFLPHDADPRATETLLAGHEIQAALAEIKGRVLLFIDSCHAGSFVHLGTRWARGDVTHLASEMASTEGGIVVYTASARRQLSRESARWGNGAFTRAVVEGLRGRADYKQAGTITVSMLETYVHDRVRELTNNEQTPTTAKPSTVPDFPVAQVAVQQPLHKRWWFWSTLGLVAAGAVVGVTLGVLARDPDASGLPAYYPFGQ
ncbi:MAG: caspase family protein [Polyangia bacterium]